MASENQFGFFDEEPKPVESPAPAPAAAQPASQAVSSEQQLEPVNASQSEPEPSAKLPAVAPYLVFALGESNYATPLLAAREVIEVPSVRSIPNTKDYFMGISNLRGEVIGLIDLRRMLNIDTELESRNSVVIYESESGPLGAVIDNVRGVINLDQSLITAEVSIKTSVPQQYLQGIGQLPDGELVVVLDLKNILQQDDLLVLRSSLEESA